MLGGVTDVGRGNPVTAESAHNFGAISAPPHISPPEAGTVALFRGVFDDLAHLMANDTVSLWRRSVGKSVILYIHAIEHSASSACVGLSRGPPEITGTTRLPAIRSNNAPRGSFPPPQPP